MVNNENNEKINFVAPTKAYSVFKIYIIINIKNCNNKNF